MAKKAQKLDLAAIFKNYQDGRIDLDGMNKPLHRRRDMDAFLLLDQILPKQYCCCMVRAAESGRIWLSADCDMLARLASEDQVRHLFFCGVVYDPDQNRLYLIV